MFLEDAAELCVQVFGQGVEWGGVLVRTGKAYMALQRWKEACKVMGYWPTFSILLEFALTT